MTVTIEKQSAAAAVATSVYAVGVVRVSERGKRDDEHFKSPDEQRERINGALKGEGLELAEVFPEIDVKGRWALKRRKGLTRAIEQIEAGYAKVLVVAYFDRLCRSISIKSEVVARVEAAGGRVLALDFGEVTEKTAVQWFSSTMIAAVAEYLSRSVGERLGGTQRMSIRAGVPIGAVPPGYRKDPETRRIVLVPDEARVMAEAFRLRAEGASWSAVRNLMRDGGIVRTSGSVRKLLRSRTYLGTLYFGQMANRDSHEPIIDQHTFDRVQGQKGEAFKSPPGRKSALLMSGLRILKCGTCGKSMAAATQVQGDRRYPLYRCNPTLECARRVSIDARLADEAVAAWVRGMILGESETESSGLELITARAEADAAQQALNQAIRTLAIVADEPSAMQTLADLKAARDQAGDHVSKLERAARALGDGVTLNAAADWDSLSLAGRRDLIAAVLSRVVVAPGSRAFSGAERLSFVSVRDEGEPLG